MEKELTCKIAILYHKPSILIENDIYMPLQIAKPATHIELEGMTSTDTLINNEEKNVLFSEFTGIYWMWKNIDSDYKGILHYRRTFTNNKFQNIRNFISELYYQAKVFLIPLRLCKSSSKTIKYLEKDENIFKQKTVDFSHDIKKYINNRYNIIVPIPLKIYPYTIKDKFISIGREYYRILDYTIKDYNQEFYNCYRNCMNSHKMYYGNLHIMDNKTHDEYSEMIFEIFKRLEFNIYNEKLVLDLYNEKISFRVFGYLGEVLTSAFVEYSKSKGKKIKEVPVLFLDK